MLRIVAFVNVLAFARLGLRLAIGKEMISSSGSNMEAEEGAEADCS